MENEHLEAACDAVANAIDDMQGGVNSQTMDMMIDGALDATDFSRHEFLEMFSNLYQCDPYQYAKNAADDAAWENENG